MHNYYKHKYHKYKNKYISQKNVLIGGGVTSYNKLVTFIKQSPINKIKKELENKLKEDNMCDKFLGKGFAGSVKISSVGSTYDVKINNKKINVPIVIKESNIDENIDLTIIKGDLFISQARNIAIEAIILSYLRKIWDKSINPHLPLLVGYSKCDDKTKSPIDKIITERHGLDKELQIKIPGFYEEPMWHKSKIDPNKLIYKTNLATLGELFKYIDIKKNGENVILPNYGKCNIVELCDYLTISYLMTDILLQKYNITMTDMHSANIFIHWLNKNSYMGNKNISKTKYIYYKYKNKYLKIKTFGLLLKIGDVGTFIINPKPKVFIAGQAYDIKKSFSIVKTVSKMQTCQWFLGQFGRLLPHKLYSKTIAFKILSTYPYTELNKLYLSNKHMKDFLTPYQMLKYFDKYLVSKPDKAKTSMII